MPVRLPRPGAAAVCAEQGGDGGSRCACHRHLSFCWGASCGGTHAASARLPCCKLQCHAANACLSQLTPSECVWLLACCRRDPDRPPDRRARPRGGDCGARGAAPARGRVRPAAAAAGAAGRPKQVRAGAAGHPDVARLLVRLGASTLLEDGRHRTALAAAAGCNAELERALLAEASERRCAGCGKQEPRLQRCSRCRAAQYCR